jgi:hypothetical protein
MIIKFLQSSASTHENKSEIVPTIKHSLRRNAELLVVQTEVMIQSGEFSTPKDFNKSKFENKLRVEKLLLKKNQQQLFDKKKAAKKSDRAKFDDALFAVKRKLNFEPHSGLFDDDSCSNSKDFLQSPSANSCEDVLEDYSTWLIDSFNYYVNLSFCMPQTILKKMISDDVIDSYPRFSKHFMQPKFDSSNKLIESLYDRVRDLKTLLRCRNYLSQQNLLDLHLDSWVAFVAGLSSSQNMTNVVSIVYLFVKERNLIQYWPFIKGLFKDFNFIFKIQSSVESDTEVDDGQSDCTHNDFVNFLRSKFKSVKHMFNSKAFKLCSKLFTMLASNFLCSTLQLKFSIAGFKVFSDSFLKRLQNSNNFTITDIFDLVMESVEYFLDIGYLCFKYKSFRPLLFDNHEQLVMAELHVKFVSSWSSVKELDWINSGFRDEVHYREDAVKLIDFYRSQYSSLKSLNTQEAEIVKRKWEVIESKLQEMVRLSMCGRLRKSPFAMCIHGGSSVGKSSISQILTTTAIIAQGGNPSPEYATVYNPNDNFFSTYKYGTEAILLDDMCNTRPEFVKNSPVEKIIEFVNNIASYPVMADLASKGKIPLEPKVITVTTNVEDLLAGVYSMEPVSILRRFNLFMTVQVKRRFAKNPEAAPEHYQLCPILARNFVKTMETLEPIDQVFADFWDIYCYTVTSGGDASKAVVVKRPLKSDANGKALPYSIREVHELVCEMASVHSKDQESVVKRISDLPKTLSDAYKDVYPHNRSAYEDLHTQSGFTIFSRFSDPNVSPVSNFFESLCLPLTTVLLSCLTLHYVLPLIASMFTMYRLSVLYYSRYRRYRNYINLAVNNPTTRIIAISTFSVGISCFVVQIIRLLAKTGSSFLRKKMDNQGNLVPLSVEELNTNSKQSNVWVNKSIIPLPVESCKTMVDFQLLNKVEKNLCIATILVDDVNQKFNFVNVFFLKTNYMVIPNHFFEVMLKKDVSHIVLRSSRSEEVQDRLTKVRFNKQHYFHISGSDLGVLYVTYGVPMSNLLKFFPTDIINRSLPAEMAYLTHEGFKRRTNARLDPGIQTTQGNNIVNGSSYNGFRYSLLDGTKTFSGMCMGTWVSNTKPTTIMGFHLGGATGTPHGCAGFISRQQLEDAIFSLSAKNIDVVNVASEGHFDPHFGLNHIRNRSRDPEMNTRPDHPINFIEDPSYIINHGVIGDTHKYRTKVVKRKYADELFDILGAQIIHGPPNMNAPPKWYHFSKNLIKFAQPGIGPSSDILQLAVNDYYLPISKELKKFYKSGKLFCRPLDKMETINGINGLRYVDGLKMNSSIGFPLSGKMSDFVQGPDSQKEFDSDSSFFWDRIGKMENLYLNGERAYPVFTAHLKDEPKKIGSDKVRVFFGASTDLKLILRKYFLPIVRLLSEIPLLSECAVGIDSHSPNWHVLMDHISTHGENRIVAGDYSGYDQQLPLNVTQACMKVLVLLAKDLGYDDKSLVIMESMIADVTTPIVNYYGSLITLMGGNPSGQNLTVYLNSIVNSVLSRCAFFELRPSFSYCYYRKYVSQITYGDDDIGSVSSDCEWFNSIDKANVLATYGLTYTPPSKTGDHSRYMNLNEVDFLKRKNTFIPDLGLNIGALDEDSILKSLSYGIKSPHVTDEELIGQVIDGALHEYFAHGAEKYEDFRYKVSTFLRKHNLSRYSLTYHLDFGARVERWHASYDAKV